MVSKALVPFCPEHQESTINIGLAAPAPAPAPGLAPASAQPQPSPSPTLPNIFHSPSPGPALALESSLWLRTSLHSQFRGVGQLSSVWPTPLPILAHQGQVGATTGHSEHSRWPLPQAHSSSLGFHRAARPVPRSRAGPTLAQPPHLAESYIVNG